MTFFAIEFFAEISAISAVEYIICWKNFVAFEVPIIAEFYPLL
jgi:hypothetical protein